MPHLLVAGTTGSGKSVGVNAMLLSILYKATPSDVRLILIDPKMLELNVYEGIPHLLAPVITDMKDAANGLRWCVAEMERRYRLMAALGVRNMAGFNKKVSDAIEEGEPIIDPLWTPDPLSMVAVDDQIPPNLDTLPAIVVVIDEFADMMMIVGKKVEQLIARIAQKARAAGIHLVLATQRPSVDVITGLIKANVPTRIGFQVSSRIDSRTILDQGGAEQLLGTALIENGARIDSRRHLKPDTSRHVRFNQTGNNVDRRTLRRQHQVNTSCPRLLSNSSNQLLNLFTDDHHHVGEFVDHHHDSRQRIEIRWNLIIHRHHRKRIGRPQWVDNRLTLFNRVANLFIKACHITHT